MEQGHILIWRRGDTRTLRYTVTDGNGDPQSLTGFTATLTVSPLFDREDAEDTVKTLDDGITADEEGGIFTVTLESDDYCMANVGRYSFDFEAIDSGGAVYTLDPTPPHAGRITILDDVTKGE